MIFYSKINNGVICIIFVNIILNIKSTNNDLRKFNKNALFFISGKKNLEPRP